MRRVTESQPISLDDVRTLAGGHRRIRRASGPSVTEWQHRDIAQARWWHLSLAEQFGNIGSEISRAVTWSTRNPETSQAALYRALDLIDLTLDDPRHRRSLPRLREIARTREVVVDFFAGPNVHGSTSASLMKYFDQFALYARRVHAAAAR
ncbi:MAG: hypothetical protein O2930_11230 [Acidobacteria bacterium]|nr:hypothetical protein [Acidobacteriota bacterium]